MNSETFTLPMENTMEWRQLGDWNFTPREGSACCADGQNLYLFGGFLCQENINDESCETNELLKFDCEKNTWHKVQQFGDVPSQRSGSVMASVGSNLYLFGGLSMSSGWMNQFHVLDTKTDTWTQVNCSGDIPCGRDKHAACVFGEDIYYFGGFGPTLASPMETIAEEDELHGIQRQQEAANFTWFNDVYKFNTATNIWSLEWKDETAGPSPRAAHTMVKLNDQSFLIFGGRDSTSRQNDTWVFSFTDKRWKMVSCKGKLPEPRSFHSSVCVGNRVVVFGGRGVTNQHFNSIDILDMDTCEWYQPIMKGSILPPAVGLCCFLATNNHVYLCSGSGSYDQMTNVCTQFNRYIYAFKISDISAHENVKNVVSTVESTSVPVAAGCSSSMA